MLFGNNKYAVLESEYNRILKQYLDVKKLLDSRAYQLFLESEEYKFYLKAFERLVKYKKDLTYYIHGFSQFYETKDMKIECNQVPSASFSFYRLYVNGETKLGDVLAKDLFHKAAKLYEAKAVCEELKGK